MDTIYALLFATSVVRKMTLIDAIGTMREIEGRKDDQTLIGDQNLTESPQIVPHEDDTTGLAVIPENEGAEDLGLDHTLVTDHQDGDVQERDPGTNQMTGKDLLTEKGGEIAAVSVVAEVIRDLVVQNAVGKTAVTKRIVMIEKQLSTAEVKDADTIGTKRSTGNPKKREAAPKTRTRLHPQNRAAHGNPVILSLRIRQKALLLLKNLMTRVKKV